MNRIRDLREDMDLRQIDVAEATGIDQKTLSNYETGKTQPDAKALIALADFFHVSIDYLLGRAELPSLNAKLIADEISKAQMQLERIKKDLQ
uniref:helix-turn-helix domain-containing protein n=1 Tax=Gemmiger formicilis TaxID=745368 RepID=UPI0040274CB0